MSRHTINHELFLVRETLKEVDVTLDDAIYKLGLVELRLDTIKKLMEEMKMEDSCNDKCESCKACVDKCTCTAC